MASVPSDPVLSHWCKLFENVQMAPLEFYDTIEQAVKRREVPNIEISRVDWSESGVFSAKREYLRISRGRHIFDICGAPFGTGFFVSSWLVRPEAAPWLLALFFLSFAGFILLAIFVRIFGLFGGPLAFVVGFPILLWGFGQIMNQQNEGWDDSIVAIPVLGAIYQRIFRPETYYKIDTMLMFQQSVHNAVLEAADQMTAAKGLRALSELERKPTLRYFTQGAAS